MPKLMGIPDDVPVQIIAVKDAIEHLDHRVTLAIICFFVMVSALMLTIRIGCLVIADAIRDYGRGVEKAIDRHSEIPTFGDK